MALSKKSLIAIAVMFVLGLCLNVGVAFAADSDEIAALKAQMADLQTKIAALEAKQAAAPAAAPAASPIEFHGYFRGRGYAGQAMKTTLTAEEIAFQPHMAVADDMDLDLHLWFYPSTPGAQPASQRTSSNYVEAAYVTFKNLPYDGKLLVGKDRNWAYGITPTGGNRLLSNYSLYSDTFHHDRVTGLQYLMKFGEDKRGSLNMALVNGYVVGTRLVGTALINQGGEVTTSVLANRDGNLNLDNNYALSMRIGGDIASRWNVGLSGYYGKISPTDVTLLGTTMGFTTTDTNNRTKRQAGVDWRYKYKNFIWQVEGTAARMSGLKYNGWQTQLGYNISSKNFIVAQYGDVNYKDENGVPALGATASWDKDQVSISLKRKLNKRAHLQFEYEFNNEKVPTGQTALTTVTGSKVKNDVAFIEYFVGY